MSKHHHVQRRAILVSAALGSASLLSLALRPRADAPHETLNLSQIFPLSLPGWMGTDNKQPLIRPPEERGKLFGIYDQVLERVYQRQKDGEQIMLSVAYGGEQTGGLELHRPEVCYRAGGFDISQLRTLNLQLSHGPLPVTQLLASQPGRNEPLTYWTLLGTHAETDRWGFRWQQIRAKLHGEVLDGLLVRVSSIARDHVAAWAIQADFAQALDKGLPPLWRARVLGAPPVPDAPPA